MKEAIRDKQTMYRMLVNGEFGNTVKQWFDVRDWMLHAAFHMNKLWGVRSLEGSNDKRSRLNIPDYQVYQYIRDNFKEGEKYNISPMVDMHAQLRCQLIDKTGEGWILEYIDTRVDLSHSNHPWRKGFRNHRVEAQRSHAKEILRVYMQTIDYEYLQLLVDDYPDHVVEFTICDRALGMWKYYNTIIWEVRAY